MAITENTRVCESCHAQFEQVGDVAVCPHCGRSTAPRHESWPRHVKDWLLQSALASMVAHVRPPNPQRAWERFLTGRLRGQFDVRGRMLSDAASAAECYPEAKRRADEWRDAGYPNLLNFDQPEQAPARKAS